VKRNKRFVEKSRNGLGVETEDSGTDSGTLRIQEHCGFRNTADSGNRAQGGTFFLAAVQQYRKNSLIELLISLQTDLLKNAAFLQLVVFRG